MPRVACFAWGSAIVLLLAATANAQSALGGDTEGFGDGRFGGGSLISGGQSGAETGQAILEQATGSTGSAFDAGTGGGTIFGGADSATGLGALGTLGALGLGRGGLGAQGLNQQRGGLNQQQTTTSPLRVPLRLSSELRSRLRSGDQARVTEFEKRLTKLPGFAKTKSVAVVLDGRTAILQGVVATQRESDLIARLVMLEPGVSKVQNDLAVGTPSAPQSLPIP